MQKLYMHYYPSRELVDLAGPFICIVKLPASSHTVAVQCNVSLLASGSLRQALNRMVHKRSGTLSLRPAESS